MTPFARFDKFQHASGLILALLSASLMSCELVTDIDRSSLGGAPAASGGDVGTSGGASGAVLTSGGTGTGGSSFEDSAPVSAMGGATTMASVGSTGGATHAVGGSSGTDAGGLNGAGGSGATGGTIGTDLDVIKSTLPYQTVPSLSATAEAAVIADLDNFGFEIFHRAAPRDENFVMSPLSGYFALAMTSAGALGTTADEMKAALFPDLSVSDVHAAVNWLGQRVRSYAQPLTHETDGDKQLVLTLVNDLFAERSLPINTAFLDLLATNYDCGVEQVDFTSHPDTACDLINDWVADKTGGKIDHLVSPDVIDANTRLVLLNTLYVNAAWKKSFFPNDTQAKTFHGKVGDATASFMNFHERLHYATGTGWVGVDIPYYGDSLVFTAILPEPGQFETVKAGLGVQWLSDFDAHAKDTYTDLTFPKFVLPSAASSWNEALSQLGIVTLFDGNRCNLQGINAESRLYVKEVLQQVFIEVNESGTEAAAATGEFVRIDMAPNIAVTFDRPFLFVIRERKGPVLFAGQVLSLP